MRPTDPAASVAAATPIAQILLTRVESRRAVEPTGAGQRGANPKIGEDASAPVVRLVRRSVEEFARASEIATEKRQAANERGAARTSGRGEQVDLYA